MNRQRICCSTALRLKFMAWMSSYSRKFYFFAERVRRKMRDLAGIQTKDLLNTSQTLVPLSHLDPCQRSRKHAA